MCTYPHLKRHLDLGIGRRIRIQGPACSARSVRIARLQPHVIPRADTNGRARPGSLRPPDRLRQRALRGMFREQVAPIDVYANCFFNTRDRQRAENRCRRRPLLVGESKANRPRYSSASRETSSGLGSLQRPDKFSHIVDYGCPAALGRARSFRHPAIRTLASCPRDSRPRRPCGGNTPSD